MSFESLSDREKTQGLRQDRIEDSADVIEESAHILQSNPDLLRKCSTDLYNEHSLDALRQVIGRDISDDTVRRAAILAEPVGAYENNALEDILMENKREQLYEELDSSAETIANLTEFVQMNEDILVNKSAKELYQMLRTIAFGSNDSMEIEQRFSQQQRRNINLGIINFIQTKEKMQEMVENNTLLDNLQESSGINPENILQVVTKPTAVLIYLNEDEFNAFEKKIGKTVRSQGLKLHSTSKDPEVTNILDKVIFLRENQTEQEKQMSDEIVEHELAHDIYQNFYHERIDKTPFSSQRDLYTQINEVSSTEDHKQMAKDLFTYYKDTAIDEIIAYSTNETYNINIDSLGGGQTENILRTIASGLALRTDITDQEKSNIYLMWNKEYRSYIDQVRQQKIITQKLMAEVKNPNSEMTREKAFSLLRMTPPHKFKRLLRYVHMDSNSYEDEVKASSNQSIDSMIDSLDAFQKTISSPDMETNDMIAAAEHANSEVLALANNHPRNLSTLLSKAVHYDYFCTIAPSILKALGESLRYDYATTSEKELRSIQESIKVSVSSIEKSSSPMKDIAQKQAERIQCQIKEQLLFLQKESSESDNITSVKQALSLFPDGDIEVWNDMIVQFLNTEFQPEHFDDLGALREKAPNTQYKTIVEQKMVTVFSLFMQRESGITENNKQKVNRMIQELLSHNLNISSSMISLMNQYMDDIHKME